ncbi:hypothetical protein G7Y79_00014g036170 [Physcia stellaris]|nr:hypothetical protein G7Y79_00014g036170 [Physcia stellaris]
MMSSTPTLPPELIELVLANSDPQSLRSIRLTCRALSLRPIPYLFRRVEFWLEEGSLQKLLDIAKTPYLAKHVKHVSCGTENFFNMNLQNFRWLVLYKRHRLYDRLQHENPAAGELRDLPKEEQNQQKAAWSEYRDCYKKQKRLYSDNVALKSLILAFSSLTALTTVGVIDPSEDRCWSGSGYSPRALFKKLRFLREDMLLLPYFAALLPRGGRQLRTLIQALADSNRRLEIFGITLFSYGTGGENILSPLSKTLRSSAKCVFSNVKELSLALPDSPPMASDKLPLQELSTCTIAQAAHRLERLWIEMPDVGTETLFLPRFVKVFGERKIGNLKEVRISRATLFEADFEAFLITSCLGLQTFHLYDARLIEGSWDPIFKAIRRMPGLKQLSLEWLRYDMDENGSFSTLCTPGMPPEPLYDYLLGRCDINPVARMIDEENARYDEEEAQQSKNVLERDRQHEN